MVGGGGGATEIGASRLYEVGRKRTYFNIGGGGGATKRGASGLYETPRKRALF